MGLAASVLMNFLIAKLALVICTKTAEPTWCLHATMCLAKLVQVGLAACASQKGCCQAHLNKFCQAHGCMKTPGWFSRFCADHKCQFCNEKVHQNGRCQAHLCQSRGCCNIPASSSRFCADHKCSFCNNCASQKGCCQAHLNKLCQAHGCMKTPGWFSCFCADHKCQFCNEKVHQNGRCQAICANHEAAATHQLHLAGSVLITSAAFATTPFCDAQLLQKLHLWSAQNLLDEAGMLQQPRDWHKWAWQRPFWWTFSLQNWHLWSAQKRLNQPGVFMQPCAWQNLFRWAWQHPFCDAQLLQKLHLWSAQNLLDEAGVLQQPRDWHKWLGSVRSDELSHCKTGTCDLHKNSWTNLESSCNHVLGKACSGGLGSIPSVMRSCCKSCTCDQHRTC